ncbi:MAG: stress response translation initiation inhibitor YciH [Pseudomonadales bacterium]
MSRVVYSTDSGRMCPECQQPEAKCRCKAVEAVSLTDGVVRVRLDRKRKGAGVSQIEGLGIAGAELKKLAKELKAKCATGGAIKDGVVEIQGDHRERLKQLLEAKGYAVKLAGG